jgi:GPH family glycoside/pentoside/hexuronide:cation symporter
VKTRDPEQTQPEVMSATRRLAFALGSPGHVAIDKVVTGILLYFYLPPPDRGLESPVSEETFFGALTAFGLAMLIARTVDSLASPLIGHASDRSQSRLGRRRSFMIYGLVPMAILPLLAYWPPGAAGSTFNMLWLTVLISIYYLSATMYTGPREALIPEIARSAEDRARLSRTMSLAAFPVAGLLMAWPKGIDWGRSMGLDATDSIRWIVAILCVLGLVLCAIPLFFIDERRFTHSEPSDLAMRETLRAAVRNHPFVVFLVTHLLFALATALIFPALPYMATVLLGRSEGFAFELGASLGTMMGVGYAVIPRLLRYVDSKTLMIACFGIFGVASAALGLLEPDAPGGPNDSRNLAIAFIALGGMGIPLAGASILPSVLLGRIIDDDRDETGSNRSAVFVGIVRAFDKWAYGLAAAVIAFLFARFGKSPAEPLGVLLIGPIAGVSALLSALLFFRFPGNRDRGVEVSPANDD